MKAQRDLPSVWESFMVGGYPAKAMMKVRAMTPRNQAT